MSHGTCRKPSRWLAVGGVVVFLACVALEHALTPSLNPASHEISEYVHTSTGAVMTAGFLAWAASLAATALYLGWQRQTRPLTVLFALASLGMVLTACFATQTSAGVLPAGATLTTTGRLHDLGSGLASLALLAGAIVSMIQIRVPRAFRRWSTGLILVAVLGSAVLLAIGPGVGGARQRLVIVAGCLWQLLLLETLPGWRSSRASRDPR